MEIWKEIEVRGHKLEVSSLGAVRIAAKTTTFTFVQRGKRRTQSATFKERVLKPSLQQLGYLEVAFTHKRKRNRFLVHRLVATAFVPGYADGRVVNHIDGNKLNNAPSNLEWVTPGENSKHAWEANLIGTRGAGSPRAVLTERQVRYIRRALATGTISLSGIAVIAGVSNANIIKIRDRKSWAHI